MATHAGSRVTPGSSDGFVASTEQLDSGTPVVSVTGEVDLATVPALDRTLRSVAEVRTGEVIVDLTSCSFFDARGLAVLNETRARLARSNRALALVLSKPIVLKIFRITGFDKQFAIYPRWARPWTPTPMHMSSWREQESETQVRSRVANESTARADAGAADGDRVSAFRCECGDQDCACAILLTLAEYEAVRAYDTHFAIARNHENPERELIEEHERFAVVETVSGEALKLARRTGRSNTIGGHAGPGSEDPPPRREVAGGGESSTRFRRSVAPEDPSWRRSFPADSIQLLNEHWHEPPGTHGPHTCPICATAISADDDAVHHGGEPYHPGCARHRGDPS